MTARPVEIRLQIDEIAVSGAVTDPGDIATALADELGRLSAAALERGDVAVAGSFFFDRLVLDVRPGATASEVGSALAAAVWAAMDGSVR